MGILEQFLSSSFRSTDSVCVHVDRDATAADWARAAALARCYRSAFPRATFLLPEERVSVRWGTMSVLRADLRCLRMLLEQDSKWK